MSQEFVLTAITADPRTIRAADAAGVDRIGIDIERIGKIERQGHAPEVRISTHRLDDLKVVAANVTRAEVFARLNPFHEGTIGEIDTALDLGARAIMLPYFIGPSEVAGFVEAIGGRASAILLLETRAAVERLPEIVAIPGVSEIVVGLNDLHLGLGLSNIFDVVVSDLMDHIAERVQQAGLRFGFGGLARLDDLMMPVPPDLVYAQYPRLGATSAWLARSFFTGLDLSEMEAAVGTLRRRMVYWADQPATAWANQREELAATLQALRVP